MLKMMRGGPRAVALVISADQTSIYNIFTSAGSPTDPVAVMVTVNSGKILKAGITTGSGWVSGSTITLINNGTIAGTGGGDTGGTFGFGGYADAGNLTEGGAGRAAGDAVAMSWDLTIDNTNGNVFGGGGMGGGGGAAAKTNPPAANDAAPGGGGGAGRGYNNASGGDKGPDNGHSNVQLPLDGSDGSSSTYGAGGQGGISGSPFIGEQVGGAGGRGGDWGEAGQNGVDGSFAFGGTGVTKPGGVGGAAGNSVRKNGKTLTWQGGNNSTQVKGPQT